MALDDDIALLANVELFSDLTNEQCRLLAFGAEQLSFSAGRTLYREGQHADCGYVIEKGEVDLVRLIDNEPQVLRTVGPGMVLGEMAMLTQTTRLTTAIARTDTVTLRINRALFRRMLEEYPQTAAMLHATLSRRLKQFLEDIGQLESRFKHVPDL